MSDVIDKLNPKAKLGKFPVWVWGAGAGVVALVAYFLWRRFSPGAAVGESGPSKAPATIDAGGYNTSGFKGGSSSNEPASPETNQGWLARVSRSVADTLQASPSEVYAALYKYVTGQAITTKEQGYIDKAIKVGMSPPEGTQGVSPIVDKIVPTPMPAPADAVLKGNRLLISDLLDKTFGGTFTDATARLIDPNSSEAISVDTWTNRYEQGWSLDKIKNAMMGGGTYAAWLKNRG